MSANLTKDLITRLAKLRTLCPDMRFGQMLATLDILSEDMVGFNLWDIEDDQLVEVVERFRQDLARRDQTIVAGGGGKGDGESGE
jgi:hypothetical protein